MPQCRGIYKSSVKENGIVSLKNEWGIEEILGGEIGERPAGKSLIRKANSKAYDTMAR